MQTLSILGDKIWDSLTNDVIKDDSCEEMSLK